MNYIIALLALPVVIKIFTHFGLQKLRLIPKSVITAEMVINQMNKQKIRPLKVELLYNDVYKDFHDKFKEKELDRQQIVAIRKYLSQHVEQYPHKKFKNDIHAIYTMLSAKDIKRRHLEIVQKIIA
ncbi:hypothetical protein CBE01nite_29500 [Clostridium beijerinckii]|uniref:Uncharacterized protein n=1 Tax=Clostridium beijerinckii TaxID=1520 RepID=A0AB74VD80_CLOBE|nr:hypothetical protein [Clostridium beijerinckii]NRZ28730.1 hypothetical protein [Clostridium beijerinckii]NYB95494.1 hypothetical protein [Clostridium beijerinckii]OOM19488.1 hypothetical protein CLBEI_50140 [Clostridium beijerinckii]QUN34408.1 hypothetical protein KEC93_21165 [Clostridium beijerinckii]SQB00637.1 Uncharacterised protein [Clostridium beijerinckii]